jgi:hypothetical protein
MIAQQCEESRDTREQSRKWRRIRPPWATIGRQKCLKSATENIPQT